MRALRLILPVALLLAACQPAPSSPPPLAITPVASAPPLDASTGAATNPRPPAPVPTSQAPSPSPAASATPSPAASSLPSASALRLVALGASDVVGLGATDPAKEGWAPVAATLLNERLGQPVALTKIGVLARTADEMRRFDVEKAVAAKPEVAVLWTGPNDIRVGVALPDFRADLDSLLDTLQATRARLYVLNMPDLDRLPFFAEYRAAYAEVVPDWQRAIREEGEAHGAVVIDLAAFTGELEAHPDYLWFDGFHPSTKGYRRLAEIVAGAVSKDLPPAR